MRALAGSVVGSLVLVVAATACQFERPPRVDDDAGPIDGMVSDTAQGDAPTVVSTTPTDLASDVEPAIVITAEFSEPMDPETLDATSFLVRRGTTAIDGAVTYDPGTRSVTFEASNSLALLGEYTATIMSAATDLGGTPLEADHSWSFSVRDGMWNAAEVIETGSGSGLFPNLSLNASGTAFAVWRQFDGTRYNIWANRLVPGTGWEIAQLVETDNAGHAQGPVVAVDASGNAIAVWPQTDGTRDNIRANRFVPGTGWENAQLIETDNAGHAGSPTVAVDAGGNSIAVWRQSDGTRDRLWANRFVPGTGWGTAQLIEDEDTGSAGNPFVVVDPDGNAVVVWNQTVGALQNVWTNRFIAGAGWGTAQQLATDANAPRVAIGADGNAIATWRQNEGTRYSVWASRLVPGSGWSTPVLLETENTGLAFSADVAIDSAGNAMAVWLHFDGARHNVWANRFVVGEGWGTAELIESDTGNAGSADVAVDDAGNAIAVWSQSNGTIDNLWANRFVVGQGWSTAALVETDDAGSAGTSSAAIDGSRRAVAIWIQSDGSVYSVTANTFD